MAVQLQTIRGMPGYQDLSDDEIVDYAKSRGIEVSGYEPPEEAGVFRSYVGIPALKGTVDVGGAVGYGLEQAERAAPKLNFDVQRGDDGSFKAVRREWSPETDSFGRKLQQQSIDTQRALTARQSKAAREDAEKTFIGKDGGWGGYNLGTLAQDVFQSAPGTLAMGLAGAPLASSVTAAAKAAGVGQFAAKVAGSGALGKSLAKGLDTALGSSVGFGASEGAYSAASNASQVQDQIRRGDINQLALNPMFWDIYDGETDPAMPVEQRLSKAQELSAQKAGDQVFADTFVKTGGISFWTGGGMFGALPGQAARKVAGEAADGFWRSARKSIGMEVLQEVPQSGLERQTTNQAIHDYVDPNQDVNEGVLNDALRGGASAVGMALGGAAGGHVRSSLLGRIPAPIIEGEQNDGTQQSSTNPGANDAVDLEQEPTDGPGGIDVAANPDAAYQRREALKQRLDETKQALQSASSADGSHIQTLIDLEDEYGQLDAALADFEKTSQKAAPRPKQTPRTEYDDSFQAASDKHGVDVDLLKALAMQESGIRQFDKDGKPVKPSTSNALGVMQIIPRWHPEFDADKLASDADYNIHAGAQFLGQLLKKHGGDAREALQDYYGSRDDAENKKYADAVLARIGGTQAGSSREAKTQPTDNTPAANSGQTSLLADRERALLADDDSKNQAGILDMPLEVQDTDPVEAAFQITPEDAIRRLGDATGDDVIKTGVSGGDFAGLGKLNIDANGNVILTRHATDLDALTKVGQSITPDQLRSVAQGGGTFGGATVNTSALADWGERTWSAAADETGSNGITGTFSIPVAELEQYIKDGKAGLAGLSEGEIILSPEVAARHLSTINGKPINQQGLNAQPHQDQQTRPSIQPVTQQLGGNDRPKPDGAVRPVSGNDSDLSALQQEPLPPESGGRDRGPGALTQQPELQIPAAQKEAETARVVGDDVPDAPVNKSPHFNAGYQHASTGGERALPPYFTDPNKKNAKDWLSGWDQAASTSNVPSAPKTAPVQIAPGNVSVAQPQATGIQPGVVGGKVSPKQVLLTASGRQTTPHPGSKLIAKADKWLLENAALEAEARGDDFNARSFRADSGAKTIPQASKDAAEQYLFGRQEEQTAPLNTPKQEPKNEQSRPTEVAPQEETTGPEQNPINNEHQEANSRIPSAQPTPQNTDSYPTQLVAPSTPKELAGAAAEPVAADTKADAVERKSTSKSVEVGMDKNISEQSIDFKMLNSRDTAKDGIPEGDNEIAMYDGLVVPIDKAIKLVAYALENKKISNFSDYQIQLLQFEGNGRDKIASKLGYGINPAKNNYMGAVSSEQFFKDHPELKGIKREYLFKSQPTQKPAQTQEDLAGAATEPVAADPIINMPEPDWVKAKLQASGIKSGAPGYAKAVKDAKTQYQAELDQALANVPFSEFAKHPSNQGIPRGDLQQAHDALREKHGKPANARIQTQQQREAASATTPVADALPNAQAKESTTFGVKSESQSNNGQARKPSTVSNHDDLLAAVAKLGGINREEAKAQGIDPAAFATRGHGIKRVFTKAGRSYDEMAELLRGHHFDVPMANDLVEKVSRAVNQGEKFYTPKGYERIAELKAQERFDDEQAQAYAELEGKLDAGDIGVEDLQDALDEFDDIFPGETLTGQDAIKALNDYFGIDDDQTTTEAGSGAADTEALQDYTEQDLADRAKADKQRTKQEESDRVKAEQKARADRERDSLVDEIMGTAPKTEDVFGATDPLENLGRAERSRKEPPKEPPKAKKKPSNKILESLGLLEGDKIELYEDIEYARAGIIFEIDDVSGNQVYLSSGRGRTSVNYRLLKGKFKKIEETPDTAEPAQKAAKNEQDAGDVSKNSPNVNTSEETKGGIKFSRRATAAESSTLPEKIGYSLSQPTTDSTVADVKSWLPSRVKPLLDAGKLRVEQSAANIPQTAESINADGIEGFYDPSEDVVYLIADNLTQDTLQPTLAHELLHRAEATDPQLKAAIDRFEDMLDRSFKHAAAGRGSAIEKAAHRRVIEAGTAAEDQAEEYRSYLVSEYSRKPDSFSGMVRKAIDDFIAAIRVALIRSGLDMGFIRSLTPADLAAMSRYGANVKQSSAKGKAENSIKFSRARPPGNNNAQYRQWLSDENKRRKDALIYNLQNRFIDLKREMQKVVKTGGVFSESQNPYMAEELYHQRAASRIKDFHDHELTPILQGLHEHSMTLEDFQEFLHARHAPSRNQVMAERNPSQAIIDRKLKAAEDALDVLRKNFATPAKALQTAMREVNKWRSAKPFKGTEEERLSLSGMSDKDAKTYMDGLHTLRRKRLTALADKIDAINDKTLDLMVNYGMEKADAIQALKDQWEHYVPLHRDEAHPEDANFGHPVGRGFSVRGSGLKTATGSNAEVTNILAHISAAREQMIRRGEKNRVSVMLANFIQANPDPNFAELGKVPIEKILVNGLVEERPDPLFKNRDNVVMFRSNGKDHAIVFNERSPEAARLALTWKNLDGVDMDKVEHIIAKGTRWLASVNTQYNVIFGIVNLTRDTQGALLNLTSTPLHGKQVQVLGNTGKALKAIAGVERGWGGVDPAMKAMYERFNKAGGTTGFSQMFGDIKERNRSIEKEFNRLGAKFKMGHATLQWLSDYNTVMENGVRLATFMVGVESGLSDAEAASIAKNITVNFNRKGAYTTKIGAGYAFFNASMQGTARLAETLAGPKGRQIMASGVALGAATAMLGILMMGADGWEDIPEFIRERSLIIPLGGSHYFAMPMPLGFHILPNIGRKFVESAFGSNRVSNVRRFAQLAGSVGSAFNPLGGSDFGQIITPTVADPIAALWRNKDWTGRNIYKEDFSRLKPTPGFTRTKDTATVGSKLASEAINKATGGSDYTPGFWSPTPDQIDYVFGQIFGGTGRELMKAGQAVESLFTDEELPLHKVPLVGRFVGETSGGAVERSAYYDNLLALNLHHAEITGLGGEENGAKKRANYLREHPEAKLYLKAKNTDKIIDDLTKRKKLLSKRGQSTRQIDDRMTALMKGLNDAVEASLAGGK